MGKIRRRRSLLQPAAETAGVPALAGPVDGAAAGEGLSRRSLLAVSGAATGAALIAAAPKIAGAIENAGGGTASEPPGVVTQASGPPPAEPVTAYVRDAQRGEVTVMSGTRETTYRDRALTKRLLDAAR